MRLSLEVLPPEGSDQVMVQLFLDAAGRDDLVKRLNALEFPQHDHDHIISEQWGVSDEMTIEKTEPGSLEVHHLKIYIRPDGEVLFTPQANGQTQANHD